MSAPYTITAGPAPGTKKPKAEGFRIELDPLAPIESLGLFLCLHQGIDAWWSCATYTDDYRKNENWQSQIALSVDIDHHDTLGQHAPLSEEARKLLEEAFPRAPGTWGHQTPSGARVIAFLDQPIVDASVYTRVWEAFVARVSVWCPRLSVGELRVDTTCGDLARFYYTPRSTAKGVKRNDELVSGLISTTSLAQLLAEAPKIEPPKPKEIKKSNGIHHADKYSRARAWLEKADPAIQGSFGSNEAIKTVERVVRGFELTEDEALDILTAWNARCQPPWSLKELKHKIEDGLKKGDTPFGELLNAETPKTNGVQTNGSSRISSDDPLSKIQLTEDKGSPAKTAGNVAELLMKHPIWKGGPSFDTYSQTEVWPLPLPDPIADIHRTHSEIVDADHSAVQAWLMEQPSAFRVRVGRHDTSAGIHLASSRKSTDLLTNWTKKLVPWDGQSRIETWTIRYLGAHDTNYNRETGAAWLVAAMERALRPGIIADCIPVLEGPQGTGKNKCLEVLFEGGPPWAPWLANIAGQNLESTESKRLACTRWILHDDELRARGPDRVDALKSWASRKIETYRLPYAKEILVPLRRALLVASTNLKSYLHDDTGNRRWWPWTTTRIDVDGLARDREQILAEALEIAKSGTELSPVWRKIFTDAGKSEASRESDDRRVRDPIVEKIEIALQAGAIPQPFTTSSIATALMFGVEAMNKSLETRIGAAMRELGYYSHRPVLSDGSRIRTYVKP